MTTFAQRLIHWQRQHGRHHLPWQTNDPYRVWLSEIMLQQTQVTTVIPYYLRFIEHYPTVIDLANAKQDDILALWSGLGYYARARNLHHAAQQICDQYAGEFPRTRKTLETLKGIGRTTAAAICAFAYGQKEAIFDGNVKRVLSRHQAIKGEVNPQKTPALWRLAENLLPDSPKDIQAYTQGLMDLGSLICTRSQPKCAQCPVATDCRAYLAGQPTAYPEKRQKQPKPEKEGYFLFITTTDNRIRLEKRPEKGIWGNLWAFPWFESLSALHQYAEEHHLQISEQLPLEHTHHFTHYTLHLHIYPAQAHSPPTDKQRDTTATERQRLGIPTPIRLIIET